MTLADGIEIKYDDSELKKAINKLLSFSKNGDPAMMQNIASIAQKNVFDHFKTDKSGPKGKWDKLADSTQKYRLKKRKKPNDMLVFSGGRGLQGSIKPENSKNQAVLATNLDYAAIHNFGGQAGRGRKTTIPQREFMWIDEKTKQKILSEIERRISEKWRK